jgi:DNA polymerase
MTSAASQPDAHRLVRQHAETARLLGVDCVPVYRKIGSAAGAMPGDPPAASSSAADEAPAERSGVTASGKDRLVCQEQLEEVRRRYVKDAPHKAFVTSFTNLVFGEGDPAARLMFIGEAPGAEEDRTGRPFVGRAGQLLEKMIIAMGLRREDVYIANVLKTRPPGNATPTSEEAEACAPYLFDQIEAIKPEAIVTLGLPATRTILRSTDSMGRLRGHWGTFTHPKTGLEVPVMPTFHPAFLLRAYTDDNRGKVWSDLQQAMKKLGLSGPRKG